MSRFRHRVTAVALGALLGGPLLVSAPALAAGSDVPVLICPPTPSAEAAPMLGLGGLLPAGGSIGWAVGDRGANVRIEPDCAPSDAASMVRAEPSDPPPTDPAFPTEFPPEPSDLVGTVDSVVPEEPDLPQASPTTPEPPAATTADVAPPTVTHSPAAVPTTPLATKGHAAPHWTGLTSAMPSALPSTKPASVSPSATAAPTTESPTAFAQVGAVKPAGSQQPIGLLALVAAVCALGVGIGAIRAFVSQRAYRSTIA